MLMFLNIFNNESVFLRASQFTLKKQKEKTNTQKWERFEINSFLSSNLSHQGYKKVATLSYPSRFNLSFSLHTKKKFNCFIKAISFISTSRTRQFLSDKKLSS